MAFRSIQLRDSSRSTIKYDFSCSGVTFANTSQASTRINSWTRQGGNELVYLDRQAAGCGSGSVVASLQLQKQGSSIRYRMGCEREPDRRSSFWCADTTTWLDGLRTGEAGEMSSRLPRTGSNARTPPTPTPLASLDGCSSTGQRTMRWHVLFNAVGRAAGAWRLRRGTLKRVAPMCTLTDRPLAARSLTP
mmetsp:Transcript_14991/g.20975  ORF Transcript_14991/g.20975 Transcript_14991/m.20975 type:complete len:191 (+) Transcript_14991:907-1479(+)